MTITLDTDPGLSPGWIRAVLFDWAIDGWVDLAVDPLTRWYAANIYAEQVAASFDAWRWLCARRGLDPGTPPDGELPEALALATQAADWTDLVVLSLTVARAQAMLFEALARRGDAERRAFDRGRRDCAGQASLAYLAVRDRTVPTGAVQERLDRLVPATRRWLAEVDATTGSAHAPRFSERLVELLTPLGHRIPQ